ncbi:MAG TPA: amylo-alpha-1,6-glucosidase [Acidobacteriota bacterium]|nr:amylo-alpha-1,6-glucosidase [Acidobacteriota bacterium]
MSGISNHGKNKTEGYVAAGDRIYLIGTQDGNFPDLGRHVEGEMGGLWLHPIKLIDGFWVNLSDLTNNQSVWLSNAEEFINYPYGNRLKYASVLKGVEVERFQFAPDGQEGFVVQYTIKNSGIQDRKLQFTFAVKTDLSPVWLAEEIGIKDQNDLVRWEPSRNFFSANDKGNSWHTVWGSTTSSSKQSTDDSIPQKTIGKGMSAFSSYDLTINKNDQTTITFVIAGSAKSKNDVINSYEYLSKNYNALLEEKKKHYTAILEKAKIKIPDKALEEVYGWVKVNNEWMVREVSGIGRGLNAGLPEYPWWFGCDNTYSLQGVMAIGDLNLAKQTLRLLKNESMKKNGNGRIIHEVSTNGVVYNPGNTQETAHFIIVVEKLFRWTGDLEFAKEMYPVMKQGIQWLMNDMDQNKNLFPEGYGIMEVFGLNAELIDVAVYTQQALKATAYIAGILNEPDVQKEYERLAAELSKKIDRDFWDDQEGSYTDFFGTREQAISAAEGAITQIKRHSDEDPEKAQERIAFYERLKQKFAAMPPVSKGWLTNENWVINTPIETGIAPKEKAISLLNKIRKENVGEYGPYLSAVEKNAMMTISTGVQAVAEAKYGRMDESLWYMNAIVKTFNRVLSGSITEMMPDYGDFTQAWTIYGIAVPIVNHIFGIQPDAYNKSISFEPQLPTGWNDISIGNLPVGASNSISFSRTKTEKGIEFKLTAKESGWKMNLKLKEVPSAKYFLNGKQVNWNPDGFQMSDRNNTLLITQ